MSLKIDTGDLLLDRKKNRLLIVLKNITKENGLPADYYTLHVLTQDCKKICVSFKKNYQMLKI
tara:strand:+ start:304 stop:492 length:189 start_codon:yes stop_codon:yes gene_type:complete